MRSSNVAPRTALDLYANLRPAKTYPGVRSRYPTVDIIVVRENTDDLYAGVEFEKHAPEAERLIRDAEEATGQPIRHDSTVSLKIVSATVSERIVRFAFDYARANSRKSDPSKVWAAFQRRPDQPSKRPQRAFADLAGRSRQLPRFPGG